MTYPIPPKIPKKFVDEPEARQLTWQEKLAALQALTRTYLAMRKPGNWYVHAPGRNIGGDGMLTGKYGQGKTPQLAVEDDWRQLVEMLPDDRYIQLDVRGVRVRWNGFMWEEKS